MIEVLWEEPAGELTGRVVADALPGYAYTTVATVLDRLTRKGLVRRRMDGRTIRFAATATRAAHTAVLMHEALNATSDPEGALIHFAETLSRSEAAVLRRTLDERDGRPQRGPRAHPRSCQGYPQRGTAPRLQPSATEAAPRRGAPSEPGDLT